MEIPRHWRLKTQRYRLEGSSCPICGQLIFPSRQVCPRCKGERTRSPGEPLPVLQASLGITEFESDIRRSITESRIG